MSKELEEFMVSLMSRLEEIKARQKMVLICLTKR
jgi:hypothetical protein